MIYPRAAFPRFSPEMAFKDYPEQKAATELLQRSLRRGRLGHAYLLSGHRLETLEAMARTLAKVLNCLQPIRSGDVAVDCCDVCPVCQRIDHANHADIHWIRPESKMRIISVEQVRAMMKEIQLKPTEAFYKVAIIAGADRLRTEAANAFLKTLEEPPDRSVLILLTTEPQRILDTILSRCLRLSIAGGSFRQGVADKLDWIASFSEMAAAEQKSLLSRYRLLDVLLKKLTTLKAGIEEGLSARSPLQEHPDVEKNLAEKWADELTAAVEAEYRRQRSELLVVLQAWLRDVWLQTLGIERQEAVAPADSQPDPHPESAELLNFPELSASAKVAARITSRQAMDNLRVLEQLQRWLGTNVQEALALEVGLLRLNL
jgi:DNA polymerase III subunit delta'